MALCFENALWTSYGTMSPHPKGEWTNSCWIPIHTCPAVRTHSGLCFASVEENKHSQWLLGKKNQIKRKKNLSLLLLMFSLKRNSLIGGKAVVAEVYFLFFVSYFLFFLVDVCFD